MNKNKYLSSIMIAAPQSKLFLVGYVCLQWDELLSEENEKETHASTWPGVTEWRKQLQELQNKQTEEKKEEEKKEGEEKPAEGEGEGEGESSSSSSTEEEEGEKPKASEEAPISALNPPKDLRVSLCQNKAVRDFILHYLQEHVAEAVKTRFIQKYEVISGVVLCYEEWGPNNGLMTPSFKVKRDKVKAFFAEQMAVEEERVEKELKVGGVTSKGLSAQVKAQQEASATSSSSTTTTTTSSTSSEEQAPAEETPAPAQEAAPAETEGNRV